MHERIRSDPAGTGISPPAFRAPPCPLAARWTAHRAASARRVHADRDPELAQELAQHRIIMSS